MFKKIFLALILAAAFIAPGFGLAANDVKIYFFWGDGCPHCAKEELFLEKVRLDYPEVEILDFEVWNNKDNQQLLSDVGKKMDVQVAGVPFTVVGEKYFSGWLSEETTGASIREELDYALANGCRDVVAQLATGSSNPPEGEECGATNKNNYGVVDLPFLGRIDLNKLSLPAITIILGALDGFNPCAMWTLVFLISLLLGMSDRKRMWILGAAFIMASAFVYFLFMSAWLKLLLFIGMIFWVRLAIAGVALAGGGYNLKKYFEGKPAVCKSSTDPKQQKVFDKLKEITRRENFYLALGGIILLAFAVNLVEMVCSAGLPALFAQILAMSGLNPWQHFLYILLYIFVFMFDDMVVFVTAMMTLKLTGMTGKYQRVSHLVGGLLMVAIGILLIFKPEWLMFG